MSGRQKRTGRWASQNKSGLVTIVYDKGHVRPAAGNQRKRQRFINFRTFADPRRDFVRRDDGG
jgi:hypothetical protein